jgi:hypothetical protein
VNNQGSIAQFETEDDAKKAGYGTKLHPNEAMLLQGMNRAERRAALARIRCDARRAKKAATP